MKIVKIRTMGFYEWQLFIYNMITHRVRKNNSKGY